jgi:hypothetical protein
MEEKGNAKKVPFILLALSTAHPQSVKEIRLTFSLGVFAFFSYPLIHGSIFLMKLKSFQAGVAEKALIAFRRSLL